MPTRFKRRLSRKSVAAYRARKARRMSKRKYGLGRNRLTRSVNPQYQIPNMWKLRYHDTIQITTGSGGGMNWHAFCANSIYDPDVTGTGHQPLLHDQLAQFWTRYTVLGSKITIKVTGNNASPTQSQYFGVIVDENNTLTSANASAIIENAKGKYKMINPYLGASTKSNNLTMTYSARKFHGKKNVIDDDFLAATFGNNPANMDYFLIWTATPMNASSNTINVSVTIDYIVRCHEPKDIAQS